MGGAASLPGERDSCDKKIRVHVSQLIEFQISSETFIVPNIVCSVVSSSKIDWIVISKKEDKNI